MKTAISILSLVALCSAKSIPTYSDTSPGCHDLMLAIPVKATNYDLGFTKVNNNADVGELVAYLDTWSTPNATESIIGEVKIDDTFSIHAQICFPLGTSKNVAQILSHGGVFDSRYCGLLRVGHWIMQHIC